jgi:LemA protein
MVYIALAIPVLILIFPVVVYNRLVRLRNRMRNAWSDIDIQLKRRHDLVPNLVEAARGYMQHERETLEAVTRTRSEATAPVADLGARISAEMLLSGAIGNLFLRSENYPQLRAAENFQLLQEQITSTENRIAYARQFYNECVRRYNTALAAFPQNLLAAVFGFSPATLFAADAGERAVPQAQE